MVTAALTAFVISLARALARRRSRAQTDAEHSHSDSGPAGGSSASASVGLWSAFFGIMIVVVIAQTTIFSIGLFEAVLAVCLSYVLAIVAARVSGETAITPIGALGKITQLTFGAVSPGQVTTNLMTANVTGGAAGQCADLMHDLKTGQLIGATPLFQFIAQVFGIMTGAFVGALAYLVLIPSPQTQLITAEWPAPAVATWKAVAEVLSQGLASMPVGAVTAMAIAAAVGVTLAVLEARLPEKLVRFVPSGSAMGLGFVIPAWNSLSLFIGALLAAMLTWAYPQIAKKRLVVIAAGLIVGESLAGVGGALWSMLG